MPYEVKQQEAAIMDEVGQRVSSVVGENEKGICEQLRQYGYSQIDGFLGAEIHGYPDSIRDQMKSLFDRGWFEQEDESDGSFKVGEYRITNQDTEHRFRAKLMGSTGDDDKKMVETQYDVAPTVISFVRSLLVSLAGPVSKVAGGKISTNVGSAEMNVFCGNGARRDRRVSNEYGWNTERGFAPDPRKLTAIYFCNPQQKPELGGHLQLEGVITPTGAVSIAPVHDRLVLFWADKTVWSIRPSQASMISEHQYCIIMQMMAEDVSNIQYDPNTFARWFPELRGQPMSMPAGRLPLPGM